MPSIPSSWFRLGWLPLLLSAAAAPLAPRPDYAGLYREGPRLVVDTRREGDSLRLYLHLPAPARLGPGRPLRIAAWPSFDARGPLWQDSIARRQQHPRRAADGSVRLSFCVAVAQVPAGAILQLTAAPFDAKEEYQEPGTTAWLRLTEAILARPFVLTDSAGQPLGRRYVRVDEAFGVDSYSLYQPVRWKRYAVSPAPALPPMTNPAAMPAGPRVLPVLDSADTQPGEPLRFATPGLYALRVGRPGSSTGPLAVLVAPNAYPALTTATELIEPLRYLTTSQERQKLTDAPAPKRAVDKFWLDIAQGNQALGKDLIKRYYGRVAAANELFAAHKAGWLTDRGLLYIVLGAPPSVRRTASGEERWYYPEGSLGGGPITYTFRLRPSTFAPDYYELVRRPEYELLWYAAVEKWRTPPTALTGPNVPSDLPAR